MHVGCCLHFLPATAETKARAPVRTPLAWPTAVQRKKLSRKKSGPLLRISPVSRYLANRCRCCAESGPTAAGTRSSAVLAPKPRTATKWESASANSPCAAIFAARKGTAAAKASVQFPPQNAFRIATQVSAATTAAAVVAAIAPISSNARMACVLSSYQLSEPTADKQPRAISSQRSA